MASIITEITDRQWEYIVENALGLRGENNPNVIMGTGASYALMGDYAETKKFDKTAWSKMLGPTISEISRNGSQYLMLVTNSYATEYGYKEGCFPKSSVTGSCVKSIEINGKNVLNLTQWVFSSIPEK